MGNTKKKKLKESHANKVTKIPKAKDKHYGMNKTLISVNAENTKQT